MSAIDDAGVLDIHTHWRPAGWGGASSLVEDEPDPREDLDTLSAESAAGGVDLRALSAPVEQLFGAEGGVKTSDVNAVNEYLAEVVTRRAGFLGLATVDAYSGDRGAEQTRYAIEELGLHGIVLDSSRYSKFLSSPEAFPTLELAAQLAVPVFVHPVQAPDADVLRQVAGAAGNSAGRGLRNAVAVLAALHADLPTRLPDLHLVFTALGHGALLYAAEQLANHDPRAETGTVRPNLYFDTMRFSVPVLRYLGEVLGPERIVIGSDWPIHRDGAQPHIDETLTAAGFDAEQREHIRIGNARNLFQLNAVTRAA